MPTHLNSKQLYELNERGKGKTYTELAEMSGLTRGAVAGRIHRYKESLRKGGVDEKPDLFDVDIGEPLTLHGDWMVVGDVHVPTTDYDFAMLPAAIARKHKIKNLVVAGDLYNMDHFSTYPKSINPITWKQEKLASIQLFSEWTRVFDRVVILMGNHDRRLERISDGGFDDSDIFAHLLGSGKVESSHYGWCVIETPTGQWRPTHPRGYSINQLVVADVLANKYKMNIIGHHEHHFGIGWDRFKHYVIINNGGLFDVKKMAYVNIEDSKSAGMAKGFTMLKDGYPTLYGEEPFTNWSDVL